MRDAIRDDYHIYSEIQSLIHQLNTFMKPRFHHVKGCQDQKPDQELTIPESLNIDYNKRALELPDDQEKEYCSNNPVMDHSSPHMQINNKIIIRWLQHQL